MCQSVIQENIFKIGTNTLEERKSKQHLVDRKLVQNRWKFESKLKICVKCTVNTKVPEENFRLSHDEVASVAW